MKIKVYSKQELAQLYFPHLKSHVAVNHLMRIVNHCPPLLEALAHEGYRKYDRTLTPRMARLVYEYIGEP